MSNNEIIKQLKELMQQNDNISKKKILGMKDKADLLTIKFKIYDLIRELDNDIQK